MSGRNVPGIFLSSTSRDLSEERNSAIEAIQQNYFPIYMENWEASPEKPKEKILEKLNQAAAVVLILGFNYGSVMDDEGISYTEFEFNKANEEGLCILSFVKLGEDGQWHNDGLDETTIDKLNNFKTKIENHSTVAYFKSNDELKEKISRTLTENNYKIQSNKDFTDKFFERQLNNSISALGERYSPCINVDLELDFFNVMAKNNSFKKTFTEKFISYYCDLKRFKIPSEYYDEYVNAVEKFKNEKENIFEDISYDFNKLSKLIKEIRDCLNDASSKFKDGSNEKHDLNVLIAKSNEFMDDLLKFPYKLLKNPILILTGDAGVGKSHSLADLACKRLDNSEVSILLLGSHFQPNEKIGKQIVNELELPFTSSQFLEKLNDKARYKKSRIFIMIDALNECKDKNLWETRLRSFIDEIKQYEWLGLVVSIRNTYLDIIPEDIIKNNNTFNHPKFDYKLFEALETFCNDNEVNFPSFPILNPEFSNPLFLKLLFKNIKKSGGNRIPQEALNFSSVIDEFLDNIERVIQKNPSVPSGFNITKMFVDKVIIFKIGNFNSDLFYKDLFRLGIDICDELGITNFQIIDILIEEGLFHKDKWGDELIVTFAYERLQDYLIAKYLLNGVERDDLFDEFGENGNIYNIINESNSINYFGVLEFLAILIPEKYGYEIYEIDFSQFNESSNIEDNLFYWFVNSLYWRKPESISEKICEYIKIKIKESYNNFSLFYESLISLSSNPNYVLNAEKLHEILFKKSMPTRDSFWLPWINKQYKDKQSVYRFVNWVFSIENIDEIDENILKLYSITLCWFLASNNVELRDKSTYAIIHLLNNNCSIVIDLLKKFENVDDSYIIERLFAIAYGCVLNCNDSNVIMELASYVYDIVYLKGKLQRNILLMDYAQCIINYANLKLGSCFNVYNCGNKSIPLEIPSDDEISLIKKQYLNDDAQNGGIYILGSMNEHFGDLGHNEFKYKFKYWNHEFNYNDLEKIMIKRVFKIYDENLHGDFDVYLEKNKYPSVYPHTVRIGEKYQRIVYYELLAELSDNYEIADLFNNNEKHFLRGSWEISIRNFDPTFGFKNKVKTTKSTSNLINFDIDDDGWSESIEGLPNIENLLNQQNIFEENDDWILLYGQINLNDSNNVNVNCNKPSKGFYVDLVGLIIKKDEKNDILEKLKYEDISLLLPDNSRFYQVFDKEYSWAASYNDLKYGSQFEELDYLNYEDKNLIHIPFDENVWDFDNYLDDNFYINILKPSELIFNALGLEYGKLSNVLYVGGNETVVDLSLKDNFEYMLIINKKELISFLNKNDLDMIWLISGAKITYDNWVHNYDKELYLKGFYYLNGNNEIEGVLNSNHHDSYFIANKKSKEFHLNYCPHVNSIEKHDEIEFKTIDDALNDGFNPCCDCMGDYLSN